LELGAVAAAPGGVVGYSVVNAGDLPIMLGEAYELERASGDGWERVELPFVFRLWGRRLESGDRCELAARVPDLAPPGRYRLRKRLAVDRDPHPGYEWVARQGIEPIEVIGEFDVTVD
jgi:hypothetical protein